MKFCFVCVFFFFCILQVMMLQAFWLTVNDIEIEPIPEDSVGKYRAEGVEWAI